MTERLKIFTGNANRALAEEICKCLNVPLGKADVGHFSDGELQIKILETCAATTPMWYSRRALR